jgi:hypothetical protein
VPFTRLAAYQNLSCDFATNKDSGLQQGQTMIDVQNLNTSELEVVSNRIIEE